MVRLDDQEQIALGDRRSRGANGRGQRSAHHPGRQRRGWTLYAHEGRLKYCYNFLGIDHYMVAATKPIPAGKHQVRMEFGYDGGGLGRAAMSRFSTTAKRWARTGRTHPTHGVFRR